MQIIHTDEWHLLASLFLNEEVPPVEGADVVSAFVFISVEIYKKIVDGFEPKHPYDTADSSLVVGIIFAEDRFVVLIGTS